MMANGVHCVEVQGDAFWKEYFELIVTTQKTVVYIS